MKTRPLFKRPSFLSFDEFSLNNSATVNPFDRLRKTSSTGASSFEST